MIAFWPTREFFCLLFGSTLVGILEDSKTLQAGVKDSPVRLQANVFHNLFSGCSLFGGFLSYFLGSFFGRSLFFVTFLTAFFLAVFFTAFFTVFVVFLAAFVVFLAAFFFAIFFAMDARQPSVQR